MIGLAATFVSEHYGGPQFLHALLIGIAFHFLTENARMPALGIEVSAKKLVRVGVALLGVRIAASDVGDLGLSGVAALIGAVVLTISFGVRAGARA
ncbi:putative sulfate exporter family transporter [Cupriavidus basilensis]